MSTFRPLVFVAMPFGKKRDPTARVDIDFDDIYERAIKPAAAAAEVDVIRADEELGGGLIHLGMFERLLLAEIVLADLTSLNANVFYELGIRHAARPRTTIPIFATVTRLPFDQAPVRALPYELAADGSLSDEEAERLKDALNVRLKLASAEGEAHDSPLFQLIKDYRGIELAHEATESFRDRVRQITEIRDRIAQLSAKPEQLDALRQIQQSLEPLQSASVELLIDLLLAYRSLGAWDQVVRFVAALPQEIREHVTVREQLAQALGRRNEIDDRRNAIAILRDVLAKFGPSAETSGVLGGIYKREYDDRLAADNEHEAAAALDAAIDAYAEGFDADPRDAYPGINLLTLLTRRAGEGDAERVGELAPVVAFALARRGAARSEDYWDVARPPVIVLLDGDSEGDRARAILARGGPREKQLVAPEYILQLTDSTLDAIETSNPDGRIGIEDLVPLEIAIAATKRYCEEFVSGADMTAFAPDAGAVYADGKDTHDGLELAVRAHLGDAEFDLDKIGFARSILASLSDGGEGDAALSILEANFKVCSGVSQSFSVAPIERLVRRRSEAGSIVFGGASLQTIHMVPVVKMSYSSARRSKGSWTQRSRPRRHE